MDSNEAPETSAALAGRIAAHLTAGKRVLVVTYTRATVYSAKHADWFRASRRPTDIGVYVRSGRKEVYCVPTTIQFER